MEFELFGKVKSIEEISYSTCVVFGNLEKSKSSDKKTALYNSKGKITKFCSLDYCGDLFNPEETYEYDKNDLLIKKCKYNSNGIERTIIYANDKKGNMIESLYFDNENDLCAKEICIYNKKNLMIKRIWEGFGVDLYKYDNNGNLLEENKYDIENNLNSRWINKYNKNGNMIEWTFFDEKSNIVSKNLYKYNSRGKMKEQYLLNSDNTKVYSKETYKYDRKGNGLEFCVFYDDGTVDITLFKYSKFDKQGNWTKKITLTNIYSFITEREIEYY